MNPITKRKLLFFLGCIPARLLLAYGAYVLLKSENKALLYVLVAVTLAIGIGFWTIYLKGWRKTGAETFGEKIWWNSLRPVHGSLYLLFSLTALMGYKDAWLFLLADVCLGVVAEINQSYLKNTTV